MQRVKDELHAKADADDALLALLVTAASRAFDRKCTGAPDAVDYFKLEAVAGEVLTGQIDADGNIICAPHKPIITAVTSFSYRKNPVETSYTVDALRTWANGPLVRAYPTDYALRQPSKCQVVISYTGGLGATVADLPPDLIELVTLLTARYYREAEGSLGDTIGVAELSTMVYTKAWPTRLVEQMQPFIRHVGWRYLS